MYREENLTIDLKVKEYNPLRLKQMDTTKLNIKLIDNGLAIDLTNLDVDIVFTKPNKTIVIQSSNIIKNNNVITVILLEDCLRLSGSANMEVELKKDTQVVSSFLVPITIEQTSKENIQSDNTLNYIEKIENIVNSINKRGNELIEEIKSDYEEIVDVDLRKEIIGARGIYNTLGNRLDKSLANKHTGNSMSAPTVAGWGRIKKLYGDIVEEGTGDKSPDNPYTLKCVGDDINLFNKDGEKTGKYINANGQEEGSETGVGFIKQIINPNNSKYIMSYKTYIGASNVRFSYFIEDTFILREVSNQNGYIFTVPEGCTMIDVRVDATDSQHFENLKIQEGSVATPYSPHGYGIVENISTDGTNTSLNVVYVDKPLCSIDKSLSITGEDFEQGDLNPVTGGEEESTLGIMRSDYIKARGNITIKRVQATMELVIFEYDSSKKFITNVNSFLGNEENIELNENTKYIRLVDAYTSVNIYKLYGEAFGIQDELDYTNKKIARRCMKRIYNGDEEWHYESQIGTCYAFNLATGEAKTNGKIISSYFKYEEGSGDTEHIRLDGSSPYARIKLYCKFATEDELKSWLAANPLEVVYELANPIIEDIECSDKIVQYSNTTTVYNTDGAEIEVSLNNSEAISDINENIKNVEEKQELLHMYSDEEQVIGKWFDKPLYRKVLKSTLPVCSSNGTSVYGNVLHNISNVDQIWVEYSFANIDGSRYTFPYIHDNNYKVDASKVTDTVVQLRNGIASFSSKECYVILNYTKTTD